MEHLQTRLSKRVLAAPDGLYVFEATPTNAAEGSWTPRTPELVVRVVVGGRCRTRRGLFREWARQLEFPSYFGRNWDAFDECIRDRDWFEPGRVVIIVTEAERVLAWSTARNLRALLEILKRAAGSAYTDELGQEIPGLTVVLIVTPDAQRDFLERLRKSRVDLPNQLPA